MLGGEVASVSGCKDFFPNDQGPEVFHIHLQLQGRDPSKLDGFASSRPQSEASHGKHNKEVDPWGEQQASIHVECLVFCLAGSTWTRSLKVSRCFKFWAAQTLPGIFRRGKDNEIQMSTRMDRIGIIGCILKAHSVTGLSRVKSEKEYEIWYEATLPILHWPGDTAWRTEKDWQSQVGVSGACYAAIYALHISFACKIEHWRGWPAGYSIQV